MIKRIVLLVTTATVSAAMVAVTAGAALGQANPVTINERIPVTGEIVEKPCTGEPTTI